VVTGRLAALPCRDFAECLRTTVGRRVGDILRAVATAPADAPTLHRLSPELYDRLVESGLLAEEPVELVDGLLVHVTPQGPEHHVLVRRLIRAFSPRGDMLQVQLPLAVPGGRPEPDLALTSDDATLSGPPRRAELVVEVCVTSWHDDRAKLPSYAAAGLPAVWLIHVRERAVHVFERPEPQERRFASETVLRTGDVLQAPVEGIAPLPVADLFAGFDG
jgi:Uma2 family endonuclease